VLLPDAVLPSKYDVRLQPDLEKFVFDGTVKISVDVHEATQEVSVHARELQFMSGSFTPASGEASIEVESYLLNLKSQVLTLTFAELLPVGAGIIEIVYTGMLNNQMAGFYRSPYTDIHGQKKMMASTQFESLDARRCFPCWDEPGRKAVFALTVVVDQALMAFSNMPEKSSQLIKVGSQWMRELVFMDSPKMSTYLAAIVVGEFDFIQTLTNHGVLIRVYTPPGRAVLGQFAMDAAKCSLDIYDDFFGLPYPLPKLDMVAIPEFSFGAMENWGLVTYREVDMLIDPKTASNSQKQRVATVVAHELAHQWFGNLVTMSWWDDLWLNEGFASWCQYFATSEVKPDYELWDQFLLDMIAPALSLDGLKTSHPIQVPIKHAEEVQEVFDHISYRKGASVIHMAHEVLGHEAFQKGLQLYMQKHQYSNTETFDLWAAWSEASGKPVGEIMATWTEQMGYPQLEVKDFKLSGTSAKLSVEQSWFLSSGEAAPDGRSWCLPIFVETPKEKGKMLLMKEKTMEIEVAVSGVDADDFVLLNAGMRVPMRVLYTKEMRQRLLQALKAGRLASCKDRTMLVMDSFALAQAGRMGVDECLQLLTAYSKETNYVVMQTISSSLVDTSKMLMGGAPEEVYKNFRKFAEKWVQTAWSNINTGFEPREDDGHLTGLLRGVMMRLTARFAAGEDFVKEVSERFEKYMADPEANATALPSEFRTALFQVMLTHGGDGVYSRLKQLIHKLKTNVEVKHILLSIGAVPDPKLKDAVLHWAISGEVKKQDFFYVFHGASESSKAGLDMAWAFLKKELPAIKEFMKSANPKIMEAVITYCASGYCTQEKADEIEKFFEDNPMPKNKRAISQVLEKTRNNANALSSALKTDIVNQEFWDELMKMF